MKRRRLELPTGWGVDLMNAITLQERASARMAGRQ
jgi:hypothetical protein